MNSPAACLAGHSYSLSTLKGWLVLLAYNVLVFTAVFFFIRHQNRTSLFVSVLGLSTALIAICFWKGP